MDDRTELCPPNAPPEGDAESDPPTYGVEMAQNVSVVYVQGGPQAPQPETGPPANDYLPLSLFTLLCCFWPLGLVALIKSMEVRRHNGDERYEDARKASKDVLLYNKIGIIIGSISSALSLAMFVGLIIFIQVY